jgi:hypothetical protein
MTFNRITGERFDGLDEYCIREFGRPPGPWRVVPTEKWQKIGDIWQRACQEAAEKFARDGIAHYNQLKFYHDNVLVQEYAQINAVAIAFWLPHNFKDYYFVKLFRIERTVIAELKANGQWDESAEQTVQ